MKFGHYPCTLEDLSVCWLMYQQQEEKFERFGQYMCNNHRDSGNPWPELFYEIDDQKAYQLCMAEIAGC